MSASEAGRYAYVKYDRCQILDASRQFVILRNMGILIGMDEAGYGPNFGPLVVAATVWQCADRNLPWSSPKRNVATFKPLVCSCLWASAVQANHETRSSAPI